MSIIDKVTEKIKSFVHQLWFDDVVWAMVIICLVSVSFLLGVDHERNQFLEQHPVSVSIDEHAVAVWTDYQNNKKQDAYFYASKNGSTYYTRDCTAGDRILDENRVYFTTSKEAEDLGYAFSKRC